MSGRIWDGSTSKCFCGWIVLVYNPILVSVVLKALGSQTTTASTTSGKGMDQSSVRVSQ